MNYTHKEKMIYYLSRSNNKTLSKKQRVFAIKRMININKSMQEPMYSKNGIKRQVNRIKEMECIK